MSAYEQRRKMEAEWNAEDQSIVATARKIKAGVLVIVTLLIMSFTWIDTGNEGTDRAQSASAGKTAQPPVKVAGH